MKDFNPSSRPLDFEKGCTIDFSPVDGLSKTVDTGKRYLSQMRGMYCDDAAVERALESGDPLVYEFHSLQLPETAGDLALAAASFTPARWAANTT